MNRMLSGQPLFLAGEAAGAGAASAASAAPSTKVMINRAIRMLTSPSLPSSRTARKLDARRQEPGWTSDLRERVDATTLRSSPGLSPLRSRFSIKSTPVACWDWRENGKPLMLAVRKRGAAAPENPEAAENRPT